MANELTHKDPGTTITQAEFIASDGTGTSLTVKRRETFSMLTVLPSLNG